MFFENIEVPQSSMHKTTANPITSCSHSIEHLISYLVASKGWQILLPMRECAKLKKAGTL